MNYKTGDLVSLCRDNDSAMYQSGYIFVTYIPRHFLFGGTKPLYAYIRPQKNFAKSNLLKVRVADICPTEEVKCLHSNQ